MLDYKVVIVEFDYSHKSFGIVLCIQNLGLLEQFFRNYYGLLCDPLKKGHVLYITYDAGSGRIEDIAPLPENASYYDPVGGAQGHIVSLSRGGVTFKLLNGEEVTAPVAPKLADFKAFANDLVSIPSSLW